MNPVATAWITVGEPETGLWCDRCMLPALICFPLSLMSASGFTPLATVIYACTECDV